MEYMKQILNQLQPANTRANNTTNSKFVLQAIFQVFVMSCDIW